MAGTKRIRDLSRCRQTTYNPLKYGQLYRYFELFATSHILLQHGTTQLHHTLTDVLIWEMRATLLSASFQGAEVVQSDRIISYGSARRVRRAKFFS